jgi:Sulfotransferase family
MKKALNTALVRTTGYQLQKPGAQRRARRRLRPGDRLLEAPAFILCSVRSGSTLLRVLLDSHSQLHSPHEMHLRNMTVQVKGDYAIKALGEVGLEERRLEYLLWDRVLHRELDESGKRWLVNKTPSDVFIVDRILECWPDARFIFLLRHPGAIARSRQTARPQDSPERNTEMVRRYLQGVEDARATLPGHTVRYEDLAAEPEGETRRICEFLDVAWEPAMLDYGRFDHGRFRSGLGDWSEKIKSGRVQPASGLPDPEHTPEPLRPFAHAWGYAPAPALHEPSPHE